MRVLFNTYPWALATPGGGEIQLQHYAEHLPAHGIEVVLHDLWKPRFDSVDIVHFFSCIQGSAPFCHYVKSRGLPLVVSSSLWLTEKTASAYPMQDIKAQLELADLVVTNSRVETEMLTRVLEIPRERFATVMNGVDPRFGATADAGLFRAHFKIDGPFVLNVANIERRKNQLNLVRALGRDGPPLVIIGHVREPDYAKEVFAEAGSRLRYLRPIEHRDPLLASAYAACSVFALPSTLETPGLAALEAAAAGAPVCITSEGSTYEYFRDLVLYVDYRDPSDIRRNIDKALALGPNPVLKEHVIANFPWLKVTSVLADLYRKLVRPATSAPD